VLSLLEDQLLGLGLDLALKTLAEFFVALSVI